MSREEEIRAAALLAAARGAVNPGVVIVNAKRFAHYIINGTDLNEVPVVVPAKDETQRYVEDPFDSPPVPSRSKGPHSYGCSFLDSRGFCTCGADPDLMPASSVSLATECANVHCGHANNWHNVDGRCSVRSPAVGFVCACEKFQVPTRRRTDG